MRCHVCHVRTIPSRLAKSIKRNVKSIVASVSSRCDVDDARDFRVGGVHLGVEVAIDEDLDFWFLCHFSFQS